VPLRTGDTDDVSDLARYLRSLAREIDEVTVVDASSASAVEAHRVAFGPDVRVLSPEWRTRNGKVGNVVTGVRHARHERVVLADDDVRYELPQLEQVADLLEHAHLVRPQNFFRPQCWHTRFDTARTLLNRVTGGDWPGTFGIRRSALLTTDGYAGDVLFENLEMVRTIRAAGGTEVVALDCYVARRPPTASHFRGQQVRGAYDEFARPLRLAVSLAVLPTAALALTRARRRELLTAAAVATAVAEVGRRRDGGDRVFPASSSLLAGPWLVWRSACSWVAVGSRLRGGVRYRGTRLAFAASPRSELRRRVKGRVIGPAGR
jgi:hypothetical protein